MSRRIFGVLLLAAFALPAVAADQPDEATRVFESLFGAKVKAAQATRAAADDVALAAQILDAAGQSTDTPKLLAILCDHAYRLGSADAAGYDHAISAMQLLALGDATQAATALERIVDLRRKQFSKARNEDKAAAGTALVSAMIEQADAKAAKGDDTGAAAILRQALIIARQNKTPHVDNLRDRIELAQQREKFRDRLASLQEKLLQNANDKAAATELVMVYVVDMNEPREAAKYVDRTENAALKQRVQLAAGGGDTVSEAQAFDLADWYRGLAVPAQGATKTAMLARAAGYYDRYLSLHATQDLTRKGAELALADVNKALDAAGYRRPNATTSTTATTPATPAIEKKPPAVAEKKPVKPTGGDKKTDKTEDQLAKIEAGKALPIGKWVELLPLLASKKYMPRGSWTMSLDGKLTSDPKAGEALLALPLTIDGDFELKLDIQTTEASGMIGAWLPTKHGHTELWVPVKQPNDGGYSKGLVDTWTVEVFETFVDVDKARDGVSDGKKRLPLNMLKAKVPNVEPAPVIVLGVWDLGVTIKSVKFRMTRGEAKLWKGYDQ